MSSRRLTLITLVALTLVTALVGIVGGSILFRKVEESKFRIQTANNIQYGRRFGSAIEALLRNGIPQDRVLAFLQEALKAGPADESRYLCLLSRDGEVLCHPETEWIGFHAENEFQFQTIDTDHVYTFRDWMRQPEDWGIILDKKGLPFQLVQRVPIESAPWIILIHTNIELLREQSRELNRTIVTVLFPMGVGFILIGTLVVRTLGRRYEAAIEEANHLLEGRVKERTSELERTVSELRKAYTALELKEKLALVGQLMAGIAHEIRSPLGAITLIAGVLEEDAEKAGEREAAAKILRAAARCELIVRNLLTFARNERPNFFPIRVGDLLSATLTFVDSDFQGSGVRFEKQLDGGDLVIEADQVQIERVILNLITNAFQEVQGVEGATMRLAAEPAGALLRLIVEDNGPGLSRELEEHLFEPFHTGKAEGTGLGLSLCRRFVERHGGRIAYDRSPTLGGARFIIELPLSQKDRLIRDSDTAAG